MFQRTVVELPEASTWVPTPTTPGSVKSQSDDWPWSTRAEGALGLGMVAFQLPATHTEPKTAEPVVVGTETVAWAPPAALNHLTSAEVGPLPTPVNEATPTPKADGPEMSTRRSLRPGAGEARPHSSVRQGPPALTPWL